MRRREIVIRIAIAAFSVILAIIAVGWACIDFYSLDRKLARSRHDLDAYAARVIVANPAAPIPPVPERLGEFDFCSGAEGLPHGFLFFCSYGIDGGLFDQNGLAYSTQPLPNIITSPDYFKHLGGNWYTVLRN